MKPITILIGLTVLAGSIASANTEIIPLWDQGVPFAGRPDGPAAKGQIASEEVRGGGVIRHISTPRLTRVAPASDRANGTAVIICPGGGYTSLSHEREGLQYARWLSTLGVTSFVLTYRLGDFGHPAPLQDVLRAMRIVRSRAAEFNVDVSRIGVMGSSAGGHLAASAGTLFRDPAGLTGESLDSVEARPNFLILMYPVISMRPGVTHPGSRSQLLGAHPDPALEARMSLENSVETDTPTTLIIHAQDDQTVSIENSIRFFQALTKAGVAAEFYAFERGGHGMGMRRGLGTASGWPGRVEEWLRQKGLVD